MMSHTFAICAYKDSPYLDACIHSLKKQSVKSKIILCTSTPSPFLEAMAKIHDIPLYVRNGKSDIQDDWNFAYEKADTRLVTIAHQDDCYHRDYAAEVQRCWERYPDTTVFTTDCAILKGETLQKPGMIQFIKMLLRLPLRLRIPPALTHIPRHPLPLLRLKPLPSRRSAAAFPSTRPSVMPGTAAVPSPMC